MKICNMRHINFFINNFAFLFCFIFGSTLLFLVMGPGDGGWILLGAKILSGGKIYSELGFNQQPLFPIYSSLVFYLSGVNILLNKFFYLPVVFIILYTLNKISKVIYSDIIPKNLFILAIFFCLITFEAFRFEDYHALTYCLVLLSLHVSIDYYLKRDSANDFILKQSLVCALTFFTRMNEGIALYISVLLVFILLPNKAKLNKFIVLFFTLIFTFLVILFFELQFLKESPFPWFYNSIIKASSAKGGGDLLIKYPIFLFLNAFKFIYYKCLYLFVLLLIIYLVSYKFKLNLFFSILLNSICISTIFILYNANLIITLTAFIVILNFIFFIYAFFSVFYLKENTKFVLFIYPLSLFILGSLSSAGVFVGLFFPLAISIIIINFVFFGNNLPNSISIKLRYTFYFLLLVVFLNSLIIRVQSPYSWHSYYSSGNPYHYNIVEDTKHGYFIAPKDLIELIAPVCEIVGRDKSLFSTPYSYANYYCDIPPWNGYVQTFFDTSTEDVISTILFKLIKSPPNFIFYQRQELNLKIHEITFNSGKSLPHRSLDEFIMKKISSGEWHIVYRSIAYPPSEWLLINTQ